MGIMDFFKRKKATMTPMEILRERANTKKDCNCASCLQANGIDVENADKIRLTYVAIEKFNSYFDGQDKFGTTYNVSSPFKLPEGMTLQEAYRVVSYISELVEREYHKEPASNNSVALTSNMLDDYGFVKQEGHPHGYSHTTGDYSRRGKYIEPVPAIETVDLFTVGGDFNEFKKSNLYKQYFEWFTEGVTFEEIQKLYSRLGLELPADKSSEATM